MDFKGTKEELVAKVHASGFDGEWTGDGTKVVFRSAGGAVLNWWPNSPRKTLQIQGTSSDATRLNALLTGGAGSSVFPPADRAIPPAPPAIIAAKAKVFVVHGHDSEARDQLELMLHRLKLDPFILQNTSGGGLTIIEALEREILSEAGPQFGIVLMTPDDFGRPKSAGSADDQPRARQNVVLEMGMLLARLGRSRVAILKKGHVELPSDASGILYVPFNVHVKETVAKLSGRLADAGFTLDANDIAKAGS